MKNKIFLFLFGLPFFGVGVWMAVSISGSVSDSMAMSSWQPVQATVSHGGYNTHSGDDSNTYEAYVTYSYQYLGTEYEGSRVGIMSGADNIGDYQQETGRRLARAASSGEPINVYVDTNNPSESVYDRELRWGMVGFKAIFLLIFGGVGLGLLIASVKVSRSKEQEEASVEHPWLANDEWQGGAIFSNAKAKMYFAWGFAAFWNLISLPLVFILPGEVLDKGNWAALLGLLFPMVGVGLIVWGVRRTQEWRRFGRAPLVLDPFPGAIGGHVGGNIDINMPYDARNQFTVSLTLVKSYVSGSGKNRKRQETGEWQETQNAHASFGNQGTRLTFRFDVPSGLRESDARKSGSTYYIWRLNLASNLPGADLDRDYEIPVYATGEESDTLSDFALEQAQANTQASDAAAIADILNLTNTASGPAIYYPMMRSLGMGIGLLLFGTIFGGIGFYLLGPENETFIGLVFALVGTSIGLYSIYHLFNSLEVTSSRGKITSVRKLFGLPIRTAEMAVSDFQSFKHNESYKTQTAGKHTVHYSLDLIDRRGSKVRVGEGFKGVNQVRAATRLVAEAFNLKLGSASSPGGIDLDEYLAG